MPRKSSTKAKATAAPARVPRGKRGKKDGSDASPHLDSDQTNAATSAGSSPFDALPAEVLRAILEYAVEHKLSRSPYAEGSPTKKRTVLKSLSKVCTAWEAIVEEQVWYDIDVLTPDEMAYLENGGQHALAYIKGLSLVSLLGPVKRYADLVRKMSNLKVLRADDASVVMPALCEHSVGDPVWPKLQAFELVWRGHDVDFARVVPHFAQLRALTSLRFVFHDKGNDTVPTTAESPAIEPLPLLKNISLEYIHGKEHAVPSAAILQLAVPDVIQQIESRGGTLPGLFAHLSTGTRPINLISLRMLDPAAVRVLLDELLHIGKRTIERLQVVADGGYNAQVDEFCPFDPSLPRMPKFADYLVAIPTSVRHIAYSGEAAVRDTVFGKLQSHTSDRRLPFSIFQKGRVQQRFGQNRVCTLLQCLVIDPERCDREYADDDFDPDSDDDTVYGEAEGPWQTYARFHESPDRVSDWYRFRDGPFKLEFGGFSDDWRSDEESEDERDDGLDYLSDLSAFFPSDDGYSDSDDDEFRRPGMIGGQMVTIDPFGYGF